MKTATLDNTESEVSHLSSMMYEGGEASFCRFCLSANPKVGGCWPYDSRSKSLDANSSLGGSQRTHLYDVY